MEWLKDLIKKIVIEVIEGSEVEIVDGKPVYRFKVKKEF